MNGIRRHDIYIETYWDYGPEGSEQYSYLEVKETPNGGWVRWEDVEDLIRKNERTEDLGGAGSRPDQLGKG